ncbi:hypothetical protein Bca52824_053929 [Brassica carinata]|uniref:Secreted protein n=1 Tax=Brassica carinata TaxID=52824 RepID=A0A8X7R568_BRACI|nr:hypothetical protein Bca52824_053929 [Brassica carinata]
MLIDMCVLVWLLACNPGMHPDMWEEWWHPACVLNMQPDMWSTRCCPDLVQFYGFRSVIVLLDTPPGSPKNCPEAKGGSVRVQISFFIVKPRLYARQYQSSPLQSSRPMGFGQVLSD